MHYHRSRYLFFGPLSLAVMKGRKTTVRIPWASRRSVAFQPGELVPAYDQRPKKGGKHFATVRITRKPYLQNSADTPQEDFEQQGFAYLEQMGLTFCGMSPRAFWDSMIEGEFDLCVVEFDVVDVLIRDEDELDIREDSEGLAALRIRAPRVTART